MDGFISFVNKNMLLYLIYTSITAILKNVRTRHILRNMDLLGGSLMNTGPPVWLTVH